MLVCLFVFPVCQSSSLDVVYVISGADGIGDDDFNKMIGFIINMVDLLHMDTRDMRVGVIQYCDQTFTEVPLGEVNNKIDLMETISNIT